MPATTRTWVLSAIASLAAAAACGTASPEIVAIEYLRATRTGDSDDAIAMLDMDTIVDRVKSRIMMVNTDGDPDRFLYDSVQTVLWGLFQETPRQDELTYDAPPADLDGQKATVRVVLTAADGTTRTRAVYLRRAGTGWLVSGRSLDELVAYAIQRLEERF